MFSPFFTNLQNDKLLGCIGQINAAVLNDVQHILNTHAKLARQVYARLNGEDHARLYGIGVGGAHIAFS